MTTAPDHWHCAMTQPLADDPGRFATAFMPEALPTQAEARQKLVAPIRAAHDSLGAMSPFWALAKVAGIWRQEPYLVIPGVAIFAVYPCDGDHDAAERAHMREIMHRAATHGNPFTTTEEATRALHRPAVLRRPAPHARSRPQDSQASPPLPPPRDSSAQARAGTSAAPGGNHRDRRGPPP